MPNSSSTQSAVRRARRLLLGLAVLVILAGMAVAFWVVRETAIGWRLTEATVAAQSRVQALDSILAQQRAVAAILADDEAVRAALVQDGTTGHERISQKLDRLRTETHSAVIYLLDREGLTIAASNWDEPASFVGSNYGFRSYFSEAMRAGTALQFALGTMSHKPGLYLSHDVRAGDRVLGVVVVKVEFTALEASWAASPDQTWVTDAGGTVLLSSRPEARFNPLPPLPAGRLSVEAAAPVPGWRLVHAVSAAPVMQAAVPAAVMAGTVLSLIALAFDRVLRARLRGQARIAAEAQRRAELEAAVADRTRDLREEVAERHRAEQRLAGMQADLVQANKLATLGQVTAGLAHEVNQPLATIRLLAENAQLMLPKRAPKDLGDNLASIVRMSERIGQITTELRSFARKATGETRPVPLREVIEASVLLTASRRKVEGARIRLPEIPQGLTVPVEAVRLEQVLVNLIQNAQEALSGRPEPEIVLGFAGYADRVELRVSDNGPGLAPGIYAQLFTPFATSKPHGLGLGLVIAQEILRDFGGELRADPPMPGRGATFRITLPRGDA